MGEKLRLLPLRRLAGWEPGLQQLGAGALGALMAAGSVFGGLHPFGMALLMGAGPARLWAAGAGVLAGYLAFLPLADGLRYLAAAAVVLAGKALFRGQFWPAAAGGCATLLAVQMMLAVSGLAGPAQSVAAVGDATLAAAWGWGLFRAGARARRGGPLGAESLLLCCAGLCGLQQLPAMGLLPGVVVLAAGGLALAFRGRLRDCAIFCLCGAGALAAADPALCFAGLAVAVGCLAAAYFTPGERLGCATLFLVGGLLGVLAAPQSSLAVGFLGSAALGEAAFFALPARLLAALPGQTDPAAARFGRETPDLRKTFDGAPPGAVKLLLAHQPKPAAEAAKSGVALQVSGHTHGGMIVGIDRLVARFNAGFVAGSYRVGDLRLYVSRGSGIWNGFPIRLGVPSEITLLRLKRQE